MAENAQATRTECEDASKVHVDQKQDLINHYKCYKDINHPVSLFVLHCKRQERRSITSKGKQSSCSRNNSFPCSFLHLFLEAETSADCVFLPFIAVVSCGAEQLGTIVKTCHPLLSCLSLLQSCESRDAFLLVCSQFQDQNKKTKPRILPTDM